MKKMKKMTVFLIVGIFLTAMRENGEIVLSTTPNIFSTTNNQNK